MEDPKEKDPDAEHPESGTLVPSYENGVATVATAGTLKSLLGDDYLNITSLKVVGYINGDDVYYLRRMLGDSSYSNDEMGNLTSLDLSQAIIKEGGATYGCQNSLDSRSAVSVFPEFPRIEKIKNKYCELDTLAMVFIWEYFYDCCRNA